MPRPLTRPVELSLPPRLDPDKLPQRVTAEVAAKIHNHYFAPISARGIREKWPLKWRIVGGRGVVDTHEFVAEAQRRFDSAPVAASHRAPAEQQAA